MGVPEGRPFLSTVVSNLLQLAHVPLLACLADQPDAVDARLLAVSVSRFDEQHQAVDVLELDEAQWDVGCSLSAPVLFTELDQLSRGLALGVVEAKIVWPVCEELYNFGSVDILVFIRNGGDLDSVGG